jgi:eukaryotic-like serine/threonine-protein kinase
MVDPGDPFADPRRAKPEAPADEDATRYVPSPAASPGQATSATPLPGGRRAARNGPRHLQPGQLLAHTYEIEALLGRGGMGEVYRARHIKLMSLHAIKVIAPELVDDTHVIEMFTEEARKLRMVRHDAVVSYDGLIGDEDGLLYLIMEFVDGVSLAKVIRERQLTPDELRGLRDRLAQGLSAAHDKLIYHRDISPDNIILVNGMVDQAKIIDFGIAKSAAAGDRTIIGNDFAGKFSYVSPEQLGMFGGEVDQRSDIYSLGLVLAAAGLGQALNMGNSPASAVEARRQIPDLGALPADLRTELEPLLEPDPANRPRSMRHLLGDEHLAYGGPAHAPGDRGSAQGAAARDSLAGQRKTLEGKPKRSAMPLILAGIAGVIMIGAAGAYFLLPSIEPHHVVASVPPTAVAPPAAPGSLAALQPPTTASPVPQPVTAPSEALALPATTAPPVTQPAAELNKAPALPAATAPPPGNSVAVLPAAIDPRTFSTRVASFARALGCADLRPDLANASAPSILGFVSSDNARGRLTQMVEAIPNLEHADDAISVRPWPQCDQLIDLINDTGALDTPTTAPRLDFNNPSRDYKLGDKLVLHVLGNATFEGYLYVDFIDSTGSVSHLLPRPKGPSNAIRAGQIVTLGDSKDSVLEIAEPLGPNLILAIFSRQRLFPPRDDETAQQYLPVLSRALHTAAHQSQTSRPNAAYAFVYALSR